jgi:hypothetical protein
VALLAAGPSLGGGPARHRHPPVRLPPDRGLGPVGHGVRPRDPRQELPARPPDRPRGAQPATLAAAPAAARCRRRLTRQRGTAAAAHSAYRDRRARRRAGRDRRSHELPAAGLARRGSLLGHHEAGRGAHGADRRPGADRLERDPSISPIRARAPSSTASASWTSR